MICSTESNTPRKTSVSAKGSISDGGVALAQKGSRLSKVLLLLLVDK